MSVAPKFRKVAIILKIIGILEIIAGIIMLIYGIAEYEDAFKGIGIGTIVSGLCTTLLIPMFFDAIAESLEYLKEISDNGKSIKKYTKEQTGKKSVSDSKPAAEDIPEI